MGAACGSEEKHDTPVNTDKAKSGSKDAAKSPKASGSKGKEDKKTKQKRESTSKMQRRLSNVEAKNRRESLKKKEEKAKDPASQNTQERLSREEARKGKKEKSLESRGSSGSRSYANSTIAVDDNDPVFAVASKVPPPQQDYRSLLIFKVTPQCRPKRVLILMTRPTSSLEKSATLSAVRRLLLHRLQPRTWSVVLQVSIERIIYFGQS